MLDACIPFLLFQLLNILKLPPAPGIKPTPSSTKPIYDSEAATIESHAPTTSYPPPIAKPEGQEAYQALFELGFVSTPYRGAKR